MLLLQIVWLINVHFLFENLELHSPESCASTQLVFADPVCPGNAQYAPETGCRLDAMDDVVVQVSFP